MNIEDNTISYLKEFGHFTFEEKEFNMVDSLILCQLSYFKLDTLVPGMGEEEPVRIKSLRKHKNYDHLYGDTRFEDQYKAFYVALYNSKRFREIPMNYFIDLIDEEMEMQFSAVTFLLDDWIYIAYRGTDETLVGWKEDFNMAFMSPVPTQVAALRYLERIAGMRQEDIVLGGHSKGGNVALYASMECSSQIHRRIRRIDCFDSPGFRDDIYRTEGYERISDRIEKIVPEASFVGMLLQNHMNYRVVKSTGAGALQHDPFTWVVKKDHFEYVKDLYKTSIYKDQALNQWICALEPDQIHTFVDTLYQIIKGTDATTLIELTKDGYKSASAMLGTFKNLDRDTRKFIRKVIILLFKNGKVTKNKN